MDAAPQASAADAARLHREALVIDGHNDTLLHILRGRPGLATPTDDGHVDLDKLAAGGVDGQFFACYIEPQYKPERALHRFLQFVDVFYRELEANADRMLHVKQAADLDRAKREGKVGAILALEGGEPILDLPVLRVLHRLGVRSIGLVWNERNHIADGVGERRSRGGLSEFGFALVEEMNRLGILVDVSHLNEAGFWDVIATSRRPVAATHSNARAVCDHVRNLRDDQIRALAKNGGIMGLNFAPAFVHPEKATLERVLDHVDHIAALVGPDHVGLGSDFDGISSTPEGLEDASRFGRITDGLLRRGYAEDAVKKILGGNFLRVFRNAVG